MKILINSETYIIGGKSNLIVLAEFKDISDKGTARMLFCACNCGNFTYKVKSKVTTLHTISCGCLNNKRLKSFGNNTHTTTPYDAAINLVINNYRTGAKSRGLSFEIPRDIFISVTSSDCAYCGSPPSRPSASKGENPSTYLFNGIDRIDSSKGYTLDNITPCCYTCNIIKSDRSVTEMYSHINKILRNISNAS